MSGLLRTPSLLLRAVRWCEDDNFQAKEPAYFSAQRCLSRTYPGGYVYPASDHAPQLYRPSSMYCERYQEKRPIYRHHGDMLGSLAQLASEELSNLNREESMLAEEYSSRGEHFDCISNRSLEYFPTAISHPTHYPQEQRNTRPTSRRFNDVETTSISTTSTNSSSHFKNETENVLPHLSAKYSGFYNCNGYIGIYSPKARATVLSRFMAKRERRVWNKKIRYDCRKNLADSRLRLKGRFVKMSPDQRMMARKKTEELQKSKAEGSSVRSDMA